MIKQIFTPCKRFRVQTVFQRLALLCIRSTGRSSKFCAMNCCWAIKSTAVFRIYYVWQTSFPYHFHTHPNDLPDYHHFLAKSGRIISYAIKRIFNRYLRIGDQWQLTSASGDRFAKCFDVWPLYKGHTKPCIHVWSLFTTVRYTTV